MADHSEKIHECCVAARAYVLHVATDGKDPEEVEDAHFEATAERFYLRVRSGPNSRQKSTRKSAIPVVHDVAKMADIVEEAVNRWNASGEQVWVELCDRDTRRTVDAWPFLPDPHETPSEQAKGIGELSAVGAVVETNNQLRFLLGDTFERLLRSNQQHMETFTQLIDARVTAATADGGNAAVAQAIEAVAPMALAVAGQWLANQGGKPGATEEDGKVKAPADLTLAEAEAELQPMLARVVAVLQSHPTILTEERYQALTGGLAMIRERAKAGEA